MRGIRHQVYYIHFCQYTNPMGSDRPPLAAGELHYYPKIKSMSARTNPVMGSERAPYLGRGVSSQTCETGKDNIQFFVSHNLSQTINL